MNLLKALAPMFFCGVFSIFAATFTPGTNFFELFVCNMLGMILTIVWMRAV